MAGGAVNMPLPTPVLSQWFFLLVPTCSFLSFLGDSAVVGCAMTMLCQVPSEALHSHPKCPKDWTLPSAIRPAGQGIGYVTLIFSHKYFPFSHVFEMKLSPLIS